MSKHITREAAKNSMNVVKYGMSYSTEGSGSFTGHEDFIDRIFDDIDERLREAFMAGWNESGEGWNAEWGVSDKEIQEKMEEYLKGLNGK